MGYSNGLPAVKNLIQRFRSNEYSYSFSDLSEEMGEHERVLVKKSWVPIELRRGYIENSSSPYIDIILCATPIVRVYGMNALGRVFSINTGGWYTRLTLDRMSEFVPRGWTVWTDNYFWRLANYEESKTYPYAHGMVVTDNGHVYGQRASEQAYASMDGKRTPLYNVQEYIERVYITIARWLQYHEFYELDKYEDHPKVRRWGDQIRGLLDDVRSTMDDIRYAQTPEEMLAAALAANHLAHVHGEIAGDYGKNNGLPRRIINRISNGADAYFSQEYLDEFLGLERVPSMPVFLTRYEYESEGIPLWVGKDKVFR